MNYASGKYARAECDRCGDVYKYTQLQEEWNGLRTCPKCWEPKHPQLDPPKARADGEALRHPRPMVKEGVFAMVGENLPKPPFEYYRLGMKGMLGHVQVVVE